MRNSLAIVGIGCRFPGGVDSPERFWQLLSRQIDAISEIPVNRWQADRFYSADTETPGKMVTRWGGFLDQVDQFDAQFFRISPREATELDPQQRLLLEVSWEALEHAGIVPEQLRGSRTGVFIGACSTDYFKLRTKLELCDTFNGYSYTGGRPSLLAGRVAYTFDFQGPAMVVDTACSSSLVALHLACQALNTREADAALVGGVNMLLDPGVFILASKLGTQSPAGRCKAFDEQADGFVRSEGCGILVLKRLEDALQDGSQILAVVRGTGVNQDGNSSSITAPDAQAQATLMRQVLANTELSPTDITYVEAHGTGTPVGDPVEFSSIWEVFGQSHQAHGNQLPVGSVKTNIGHCEAASGIASVIKTVLALQHREIPANLHFQRLNPTIPAEAANMLVPTSTMPWTIPGSKRYAAINSFGFSGTNAHLVLEEAERRERSLPEQTVPAPMLCLSAPSAPALIAQVQRYQDYLSVSHVPLEMICQAANTRRTHFRYRQGFTGQTVEQLQQSLSSFIAVADPPKATSSQQPPKVAFLFTGQGSQSVQMGQQLLASNAVFRETMEMCDRLLRPHLGESLLELIYGSNHPDAEHQLQQTALAQPAIFALEYALYQTWRSWGITPDIVLGHSVGEYVAACVSGLFSLEQGLVLIATRGQLMQALPAGGGMAAVAAPPPTIEAVLGGRLPETISVAAINAPDQTVLSGDEETLQGILPILEQQEMTVRRLPVSHGFHSALLEPMLEPLRQALEQVDFGSLHIPLVSNLTGQQMTAQAMGQPDYWLAHTRQAVQFETSMHTLEAAGAQLFVEIGPRPTLINLGQRCLPDSSATWLMSLRPGFNDTQMMAESLVHLYSQGIEPDWRALYPDQSFPMIDLPTYPFQRKRYWSEFAYPATNLTSQPATAIALTESPVHPLLGYRGQVELSGQTYFQNHLSAQTPPYFVDHQVDDAVIMPGAAYVEMAIAAGSQLSPELSFVVSNLHLKVPIALSTELPRSVQMLLTPQEDRIEFAIASTDCASTTSSPNWIQHATGEIIFEKKSHQSVPLLEEMRPRFQETLDRQSIYAEMEQTGLKYGPSFQGVQELWVTASQIEALGRICLPSNLRADAVNYFLHPVLLDGCSQVSRWADGSNIHTVSKVPFFYESVEIYGKAGDQIWCYVRQSDVAQAGDRNPPVDIFIYDLNGTPIAAILGLYRITFDRLSDAEQQQRQLLAQDAYETRWQPQPLPSVAAMTQESQVSHLDGLTLLLLPATEHSWADAIAATICRQAEAVVQVRLGSTFEQRSTREYEIAVNSHTDFQTLLQEIASSGAPALKRILHLGLLAQTGKLTSAIVSTTALTAQVTDSCASTLHLVQALAQRDQPWPCELWLMTGGCQRPVADLPRAFELSGAPLWGLGRVIRSEHPELNCRQIDLDPFNQAGAGEILLAELQQPSDEEEVAYCQGQRWVPRLSRLTLNAATATGLDCPEAEAFQLDIETRGLLNTLQLVPQERHAPEPGQVEVEVVAAGLNFRDVLNALGTYKGKQGPLGGEFAGRVVRVGQGVDPAWIGKKVLGLATGTFRRYVLAHHQVIAELPDSLSFEQGAAIPITFLTAYQTLYEIGQIKAGDRVLIHAGAGGVGLAAIQLAQRAGAEVFATAGSEEKRALLRSLGVPHVMNSRTTDFAAAIRTLTAEEGIDLVLNSLTGEFIVKGLSVLRPGGKFIELGKAELWSDAQLAQVKPDISYIPYYLGDYRDHEPALVQSMFQALLDLFAQGELQVLYKAFPIQKATEGFRLMQRGGHIGKLVLTFRQIRPQGQIDPEGTYLLTGGLGGIGWQLTQRLAERGARHLALLSRRGPTQLSDGSAAAEKANTVLQQLAQQGVQIEILQADVASQTELSQAIEEIRASMPPLRGIFHAAGALEDGLLLGQNWARCQKGLAAKVQGTWNLHRLTLDAELDSFVMFSSVTSLLGPAARGPYAAGNLFLDRMADYRNQLGLPSLTVNWGAWANTGMAKEIRSQRANLQRLQMLTPAAGLDCLEHLMTRDVSQVGIFPLNWQEFQKRFSGDRVPRYFENLVSEALQAPQTSTQSLTGLSSGAGKPSFAPAHPQSLPARTLLQTLGSVTLEQRPATLQSELIKGISQLLGLDQDTELEPNQPLEQYGLDSLMTVELRNWLLKELEVKVPVVKLTKTITVIDLTQLLLQSLPEELPKPAVNVAPPASPNFRVQPPAPVNLAPASRPPGVRSNSPILPSQKRQTLKQTLLTLPNEDQPPFLQRSLTENISNMLGMESATELEPNQPLEIYGLDSLMTVELRNWLSKELTVNLPVVQLGKSLTITDLLQLVLAAMSLPSISEAATPVTPPSPTSPNSVKPVSPGPSTAAANLQPSSDNRYSLIFKLRELIYEREDDDLTTPERLIRDAVRQISGIEGMEQIIQDYCSQKQADETLQQSCMRRLNLELDFNESALSHIPQAGPTVIVANHPFGYIDGAITEYLVSLCRTDFKILSAPFGKANRFPAREKFLLPLDVQNLLKGEITEEDMNTMNTAIEYVQQGGALVIFPSGLVSLSRQWSGKHAVDRSWQPFAAQVVTKSRATVVPIYFDGQNSRLFQLLTKLGGMTALATFVAREQLSKVGSKITFRIGPQLSYESLSHFKDYRSLTRYLQFITYELKQELKQ